MASTDILLAGRTGNGKSSTGNSILNNKVFTPRGINSAVTTDVQKGSTVIHGKTVTVVDGLDLGDTSTEGRDNVQATIELAEKIVGMTVNGFSAILVCLKYGIRYTNQEKEAVRAIKSLLGDDVIKKYGIIVMTHGDNFDTDVEEERKTFEQWCQEQTGDVKELFKECDNRYVIFNNRTKDAGRVKQQLNILMSKIAEVQSRVSPYTRETFQRANQGRRKLLVQSKLPDMQIRTNNLLDYVSQNLRKLEDSYYSPSNYLRELERLKHEVDSLKSFLQREDEGTNSIGQLILQISVTETTINTKKERHLRKIEYDEQIQRLDIKPPAVKDKFPAFIKIGIAVFIVVLVFILFYYLFAPRATIESETVPAGGDASHSNFNGAG